MLNIRKNFFIIALILFAFTFTGCRKQSVPTPTPTVMPVENTNTEVTPQALGEKTLEYQFTANENGVRVFELDKDSAEIEYDTYDGLGEFITSINGQSADTTHFWAFYLNGESSQTGASQTTLKQGDVIKFVYEEIKPFN